MIKWIKIKDGLLPKIMERKQLKGLMYLIKIIKINSKMKKIK